MMCSETTLPRSSFSYDQPHKPDVPNPDSDKEESQGSDFEFTVCSSLEPESSSADELFSNGMILPLQIEPRPSPPVPTKSSNKLPPVVPVPRKDEKLSWAFGRTSSVPGHSEAEPNFPRRSLLCSFPLLPRSNSTGSAPNTKKAQNKQPGIAMRKSSSVPSSSSSSSGYGHSWSQKNTLGRSQVRHGVRVSPVLNVPTACICEGTASFFGLGSFLRGGKDKKTRR